MEMRWHSLPISILGGVMPSEDISARSGIGVWAIAIFLKYRQQISTRKADALDRLIAFQILIG